MVRCRASCIGGGSWTRLWPLPRFLLHIWREAPSYNVVTSTQRRKRHERLPRMSGQETAKEEPNSTEIAEVPTSVDGPKRQLKSLGGSSSPL